MSSDCHVDLGFPLINREGQMDILGWWFTHLLIWEELPGKCTCTVILQMGECCALLGCHLGCSQQETSGKTPANKTSPLPKNPLVKDPGARYELKSH